MMWFLLFILLILIGVLMWFHRKSAQEWERELAYLMRHEQDERNQSVDLSDGEPEHRNVSVSPMLSNAREAAKSKQKAIETRELAEQLKESSLPAPRRRAQHQASDDLLPMFDGAEASAVDERHADVVDEREGDDEHGALAQDSDSADLAATPAVAKPVEVITFETATQLAAKVAAVKHKPRPMAASTPRETILLATQKQALIAPEANVHAYQAPTATKTKKYTVPHDDDALPVIGIDDIRVNLLKQRELRRRKSAEGQGPQQLVLPVIEAEEAFANLAHAKVPYSRGSTVVKQMVTRSSVIPSSARVVGPHVVAQTPTPVAVAPTPPISSRFTPFEHAPYTPPVSKVTAGYPSAPEAKPLASLLHSKATEDMAVGAASAATAAALATPVNVPSPMPVAIGRNSMVSGNDLVVDAPAWRIQDKLVAESAQPLIITPEPDEGASAPELLMHDEPMAEAEAQARAPAAIVATKPALKTATALSFDMDEVLTPSAAALTAASLVAAEAEQARVASDDGAEEGMDFELDAVVEQSVATVFAAEAEQDVTPVFEVDVTPEMPVASEAEQAIALGFEAEAEQDFDPVFEVDVTPEMPVASEVEQAIALGFEDEAEQDFDPVFEVDVTPEMPVATEAEQVIDPRLAVEAESNMAVMADATAVQNGVEPVVAAGDTPERLAESVAEVLVAEEVAAVEASVLSSDSDAVYLEAEQVDAPWEDDVPVIDVATDEDEVIEVEAVATAFAYATATEPVPEASFAEGDEDAADYVDDQALATPEEPEAATWAPKREVVIQPPAPKWDFPLPDLSLLNGLPDDQATPISEDYLIESGIVIEEKLAEFRVKVKVVDSYAGPVVTRHEIEPEAGVRGSQVVNLEKDLSRALGFAAIRVVETIPGKTCMGLELPNPKRKTIRLAEIFSSPAFQESSSKLTLALGQDITGEPIVTNLAKAPHLLVAGTTGSGKSVGVNAMILSLLFKATPEEVRLIMIDPKMLELSIYEGIPHLLAPVVTDMRLAANALTWCVNEMEKRYRLMSHMGVRNLAGFNAKVKEATARGESLADPFSLTPETPNRLEPLPFIVVVVDEFADLMMTAGKKIEELIARLAQKARAAGIHLILATQRPSVDVITGLIKANIPTRIAFQVSSKIDSRTILDQMGAESLLGMGDMLFLPPGTAYPQRIHGAFVADEEVHHVVEYLKQYGEPQYVEDILSAGVEEGDLFSNGNSRSNNGDEDPLYDEAVALVIKTQRASISSVQRQLRIGYNRAARLVEQMEQEGVVSAPENNGNRSVLALGSGDE